MYISSALSDPFYFKKIYTSIIKIVMLFILFVKINYIRKDRTCTLEIKEKAMSSYMGI